jgi:hypothetical protein
MTTFRSMARYLLALSLLASAAARADDEHLMFHVGATVGVGLPRPANVGAFVKLMDFVSLGFSYSDFPNFVADPLLSAFGAKSDTTVARLDEFTSYEGEVRIYPFHDAFFFGSSLGHQSLKGAVTESTVVGPQTGTADVQTLYLTPRLGWLWSWPSGLLLGVDGGVQITLSKDITTNVPPGAPPEVQDDVQHLRDAAGYPLPSVHFRVGWQF